jgi:hypothetical protein
LAATDARIHFGELVDAVAETGELVRVQRSDDFAVAVAPAESIDSAGKEFDAEAWWANLERLHAEIRAYWEANPEARITESSAEIIRELRDSD